MRSGVVLTKHKLVLVDQIRHPKVHRSKYQDQRLDDTIDDRDHKDEDGQRIYGSVVDHRRRIELRVI